ncbi:hypothetical protein LTS17_004957 [Exophiala oligosperma]
MAPPQANIFITYSNPEEFKSQKNRQAVSSFASRSYRPTSKKIVLERNNYRPFTLRHDGPASASPGSNDKIKRRTIPAKKHASPSTADAQETPASRQIHPLDERALGSPSADPFTTYPIAFKPYVPFLVDYFIRCLTPRFSPALAVETSRYLIWFNVAMHHAELFHALVALSQVYYDIDMKGFGTTHWTALYHRGESLKQLRVKVENVQCADDDAAILTALWLMDVDAAHGDLQAYAMHKRAKERMVAGRGGIRSLHPELQDELLKSEFFLPLLLHGRFVCDLTSDGDVLVQFRENRPVQTSKLNRFPKFLSIVSDKGLLTSQTVIILHRLYDQVSIEPHQSESDSPLNVGDPNFNEMSRVLQIADEVHLESLEHRLMLALSIYIFNFHNQPQSLPRTRVPSSTSTGTVRHSHLKILSQVALELCHPTTPTTAKTEREVTLWTMLAIAAASSFSPWRLEIPFMGHLIDWMDNDEVAEVEQHLEPRESHAPTKNKPGTISSSPGAMSGHQTNNPVTNLEKLTTCLRGYYLYGADKETLKSLQKWKNTGQSHGLLE